MVKVRRRSAAQVQEMIDVPLGTQMALKTETAKTRPKTLLALVALITTLASYLVLLAKYQYRGWTSNGVSIVKPQSSADDRPYQLHPLEHCARPPTISHLHWRITSGVRRPDGVAKEVYLVNDVFPGPTVEARSGDYLIIEVENGLQDGGLSVHWHGLSMRGANGMDGAVGITQAPIMPQETFTYNFTIENSQYGTFWWHAHSAVQRADGLFGGLIVHEPCDAWETTAARDEYLLMSQDWYHRSAEEALEFYMHPGSFGNEPVPDSVLINGAGVFNCSDAVPARPLDCQSKTLQDMPALKMDRNRQNVLRVINVGAYASVGISFTNALMTPLRVDGGNSVTGTSAQSIRFLHPGERIDVRIESTTGPSSSLSRIDIALDTNSFKHPNPALTTTHHMVVEWIGAATDALEIADVSREELDLDTLRAPIGHAPPELPDETIVLYTITQKLARLSNTPHGFINNTYWQPQTSPAQPLLALQREQWDKHQLVPHIPFKPDAPLWIDIVLNNLDEEAHPFHLHGHDFWVLSTYSSTFNWGSYNPFTGEDPPGGVYTVNPIKKDTVAVPRRGYAVIRFRADNPGIWMFHCHVMWHLASGMAMAFEVS